MKRISILLLAGILMGTSALLAQDAEGYFKKGEQLKANEKYKEAAEAYSKAIKLDPENPNYLLQRAFCYNVQGDYENSIKDYSAIIKMSPDNKFSYLSRGSARMKLKKYQAALSDFNKVVELDPKDQEGYNNRGWAKDALGDHKGACADWKKSKKLGNDEAKIILKNTKCK